MIANRQDAKDAKREERKYVFLFSLLGVLAVELEGGMHGAE
jgi:hypothetical protein